MSNLDLRELEKGYDQNGYDPFCCGFDPCHYGSSRCHDTEASTQYSQAAADAAIAGLFNSNWYRYILAGDSSSSPSTGRGRRWGFSFTDSKSRASFQPKMPPRAAKYDSIGPQPARSISPRGITTLSWYHQEEEPCQNKENDRKIDGQLSPLVARKEIESNSNNATPQVYVIIFLACRHCYPDPFSPRSANLPFVVLSPAGAVGRLRHLGDTGFRTYRYSATMWRSVSSEMAICALS